MNRDYAVVDKNKRKKEYLLAEIKDKGYDPEEYIEFLLKTKEGENLTLDDFSMSELQGSVVQFKFKYKKKEKGEFIHSMSKMGENVFKIDEPLPMPTKSHLKKKDISAESTHEKVVEVIAKEEIKKNEIKVGGIVPVGKEGDNVATNVIIDEKEKMKKDGNNDKDKVVIGNNKGKENEMGKEKVIEKSMGKNIKNIEKEKEKDNSKSIINENKSNDVINEIEKGKLNVKENEKEKEKAFEKDCPKEKLNDIHILKDKEKEKEQLKEHPKDKAQEIIKEQDQLKNKLLEKEKDKSDNNIKDKSSNNINNQPKEISKDQPKEISKDQPKEISKESIINLKDKAELKDTTQIKEPQISIVSQNPILSQAIVPHNPSSTSSSNPETRLIHISPTNIIQSKPIDEKPQQNLPSKPKEQPKPSTSSTHIQLTKPTDSRTHSKSVLNKKDYKKAVALNKLDDDLIHSSTGLVKQEKSFKPIINVEAQKKKKYDDYIIIS